MDYPQQPTSPGRLPPMPPPQQFRYDPPLAYQPPQHDAGGYSPRSGLVRALYVMGMIIGCCVALAQLQNYLNIRESLGRNSSRTYVLYPFRSEAVAMGYMAVACVSGLLLATGALLALAGTSAGRALVITGAVLVLACEVFNSAVMFLTTRELGTRVDAFLAARLAGVAKSAVFPIVCLVVLPRVRRSAVA